MLPDILKKVEPLPSEFVDVPELKSNICDECQDIKNTYAVLTKYGIRFRQLCKNCLNICNYIIMVEKLEDYNKKRLKGFYKNILITKPERGSLSAGIKVNLKDGD